MFEKQFRISGRHAFEMNALRSVISEKPRLTIFESLISLYINAPLIGFLYSRTAGKDTSRDETSDFRELSIFQDTIRKYDSDLTLNYQLIMLLDKEYESDLEKRVAKAFRTAVIAPEDEERFNSYVRGGIDVLYEAIIENNDAKSSEEYIENLYEFIYEFNERFNSPLMKEHIDKLLK